jgi:hypothetical protein
MFQFPYTFTKIKSELNWTLRLTLIWNIIFIKYPSEVWNSSQENKWKSRKSFFGGEIYIPDGDVTLCNRKFHMSRTFLKNHGTHRCWAGTCAIEWVIICALKFVSQVSCIVGRGQFLTTWFAPRGELGPQGWTLSPRGTVHPFVHPFVHPQGWTLSTV